MSTKQPEDDLKDPLWSKQDFETLKAFEVFCLYRDNRNWSLRDISQEHYGVEHSKHVMDWSRNYHWVKRKEAYWVHVDKELTEAALAAKKEAVKKAVIQVTGEMEDLVQVALEKAKEGNVTMLKDLFDRTGFKSDESKTIEIENKNDDENKTLQTITERLGWQ